jgi:hypothetical protein
MVGVDKAERPHLTVELIDPVQHILSGLNRGQLTRTVGDYELGCSEVGGRAHGVLPVLAARRARCRRCTRG